MLPKKHLIFGIVFFVILFLLFPNIGFLGFSLIIFSTVLIDVDHYIYYIIKKKDINFKRAHQWFINRLKKIISLPRIERNNFLGKICFLHGIEVLLILFFLGIFLSKYFIYIFIGFSFHLLLDSVDQTMYWDRIDKFSLISDYFKFKKLKSVGHEN